MLMPMFTFDAISNAIHGSADGWKGSRVVSITNRDFWDLSLKNWLISKKLFYCFVQKAFVSG